jgi:hypothetical protein
LTTLDAATEFAFEARVSVEAPIVGDASGSATVGV